MIHLVTFGLGLRGGGRRKVNRDQSQRALQAITTGQYIQQKITSDQNVGQWAHEYSFGFNVLIVNSESLRELTGFAPPRRPISQSSYKELKMSLHDYYRQRISELYCWLRLSCSPRLGHQQEESTTTNTDSSSRMPSTTQLLGVLDKLDFHTY